MSTTPDDARAAAPRDPWRESLRASRERRAAAFRRRRRRLRGRTGAVVALASLSVMAGGAFAAPAEPTGVVRAGAVGGLVAGVQRAVGVTADGVFGPQTRAAVKRFQRRHGLVVDGIAGPATLRALGIAASGVPVAAAASTGSSARSASSGSAELDRIARCESGGDPSAVSPDGTYRGKYQFSRATWRAMGGSGDPAAAPESVQDRMAALLMQRQGPSAWPNCA